MSTVKAGARSVIPARALGAANRILVQLPRTGWTPEDRDIAAAVVASEMGEGKALEACRLLAHAFSAAKHRADGCVQWGDVRAAHEVALLALRR